ncbi:DEAD/DEAH box helicase [Auritidibacter ignavus]|uniref:DNA 3'-5' helicase n=1 Tax=Auritidibacter ignavus TaxID=678932 RepID=A0AAJ6AHB4_9MICC|nr:DNA repair helicase XPB [Auritidibacter ignavus]WGH92027.1 DEAD/DEAH box helicase [Auritidibacter ignavus]
MNSPAPEPTGAIIVQSDRSILLELQHPAADDARRALAQFAELERAPEHVHTYRMTALGLWNARAAGVDAEQVIDTLFTHSRYPLPQNLLIDIAELMSRYGRLALTVDPQHGLVLRSDDAAVLEEVLRAQTTRDLVGAQLDGYTVVVHSTARGELKQALVQLGWPADDQAGYVEGTAFPIQLTENETWQLRDYQRMAVDNFFATGSGVVVMPPGSGKTLVGAAALAASSTIALVLVTNTVSARQWKAELLARTTLTETDVGEYSGSKKQIRPVTIATYQVLTTRRGGIYPHLELVNDHDWGLIIYDEVHLLPAPIFRMTADLQARRRLGLTATLVREDNRADEVFSLIGPKRYDAPWKDLEAQGWIAPASCTEIRVTLSAEDRIGYAISDRGDQYRWAATAESKMPVITELVDFHRYEQLLVIGQYVDHLEAIGDAIDAEVITGSTSVAQREKLFNAFRAGQVQRLVVSKIANFSLDLPEATVAIQVSGAFGSRQEEAQRLGRLMRPKSDGRNAYFYTVVSRDTVDQQYAASRQRFLSEQGYSYRILDAGDLPDHLP